MCSAAIEVRRSNSPSAESSMHIPPELRCPHHQRPLADQGGVRVEDLSLLTCDAGCSFPILGGIPRFVGSANYASAFGLQWNSFRTTQLDSHSGTSISKDRLTRCLGGDAEVLRGRSVLEVGCGAGRFTELMLEVGARVVACDLSSAVEANYANCSALGGENYFVCQADVRQLPLVPASFDFVVCLGVIQHTPKPEETIAALARYVRPGGTLVMDHYAPGYSSNFLQRNLRRVFIRLPPRISKWASLSVSRALLPLHRLTWKNRRGLWRLRAPLLRHSPLIDYHDAYGQLGDRLLSEWSVLDTHDTLTDFYKHLRTTSQIEKCLRSCGLTELEVYYGGNGVEARGKMPGPSRASL